MKLLIINPLLIILNRYLLSSKTHSIGYDCMKFSSNVHTNSLILSPLSNETAQNCWDLGSFPED